MNDNNDKNNENSSENNKHNNRGRWVLILGILLLLLGGSFLYFQSFDALPGIGDNNLEVEEYKDEMNYQELENNNQNKNNEEQETTDLPPKNESQETISSNLQMPEEAEEQVIEQEQPKEITNKDGQAVEEKEITEAPTEDNKPVKQGQNTEPIKNNEEESKEVVDVSTDNQLTAQNESKVQEQTVAQKSSEQESADIVSEKKEEVKVNEKNQTEESLTSKIFNKVKETINKISDGAKNITNKVINTVTGINDDELDKNIDLMMVGLDNKKSVAKGLVEADSIIVASLRPNENVLDVNAINSDLTVDNKPLKKYDHQNLQIKVEELTENKITHYVYVDYSAFEKVIDEMGGIQVELEEDLVIPQLGLNLKAGENLLSGREALNYVRWYNYDINNNDRIKRQKQVLNAIIEKAMHGDIMFDISSMFNTVVKTFSSVETNLSPTLITDIFNYLKKNNDLKINYRVIEK